MAARVAALPVEVILLKVGLLGILEHARVRTINKAMLKAVDTQLPPIDVDAELKIRGDGRYYFYNIGVYEPLCDKALIAKMKAGGCDLAFGTYRLMWSPDIDDDDEDENTWQGHMHTMAKRLWDRVEGHDVGSIETTGMCYHAKTQTLWLGVKREFDNDDDDITPDRWLSVPVADLYRPVWWGFGCRPASGVVWIL